MGKMVLDGRVSSVPPHKDVVLSGGGLRRDVSKHLTVLDLTHRGFGEEDLPVINLISRRNMDFSVQKTSLSDVPVPSPEGNSIKPHVVLFGFLPIAGLSEREVERTKSRNISLKRRLMELARCHFVVSGRGLLISTGNMIDIEACTEATRRFEDFLRRRTEYLRRHGLI